MALFSAIGNVIDTTLNYIWKGFVALLKYALILGVLIIYGVYELAKGIVDYGKRAWKRVKSRFPGAKASDITTVGGEKLLEAINSIKQNATKGEDISMSELEDIEDKFRSGEANAANVMSGKNANGDDAILDIEFINANGINQNEVYTRMITKN